MSDEHVSHETRTNRWQDIVDEVQSTYVQPWVRSQRKDAAGNYPVKPGESLVGSHIKFISFGRCGDGVVTFHRGNVVVLRNVQGFDIRHDMNMPLFLVDCEWWLVARGVDV